MGGAGRGGTSVRTQGWETRLPIAPQLRGLWASGSTFLSWVLLKNGLPHHQPPFPTRAHERTQRPENRAPVPASSLH